MEVAGKAGVTALPLQPGQPPGTALDLIFDHQGLALREHLQEHGTRTVGAKARPAKPSTRIVRCDFLSGASRHRRIYGGGKSQALLKAVGLSGRYRPWISDLGAGLGRDAFVMACAGARLTLLERHPVVAALLADGLRRLEAEDGETERELAGRMDLHNVDARTWLGQLDAGVRPDVLYLDPMFPPRHKSAKVKKEMACFHRLIGEDFDGGEVLELALESARYRVVVKRPRLAPPLGDKPAPLQLEGKTTRFDVYPLRKMPD